MAQWRKGGQSLVVAGLRWHTRFISQREYALEGSRPRNDDGTSSTGRQGRTRDEEGSQSEDPFSIVKDELTAVSDRMRRGIATEVPSLATAAEYFFRPGSEGKRVRPTALLLLAGALSGAPPTAEQATADHTPPSESAELATRRKQQRLAEVTELMHVASLLHDDVLDGAESRRGREALNRAVGNKLAVLAGDFLLARASATLASLGNTEVVRMLSKVLEHLVAGEAMQLSAGESELASFEHYLRKTYYKTASMLSHSSKAVACLGGLDSESMEAAEGFGECLGMAFQLVDDVLDFTASDDALGKPSLADLSQGIATAPVLYASEEHPELRSAIRRRFDLPGDVAFVHKRVLASDGITRASILASEYAESALEHLDQLPFPDTPFAWRCRSGLVALTRHVIARCS